MGGSQKRSGSIIVLQNLLYNNAGRALNVIWHHSNSYPPKNVSEIHSTKKQLYFSVKVLIANVTRLSKNVKSNCTDLYVGP